MSTATKQELEFDPDVETREFDWLSRLTCRDLPSFFVPATSTTTVFKEIALVQLFPRREFRSRPLMNMGLVAQKCPCSPLPHVHNYPLFTITPCLQFPNWKGDLSSEVEGRRWITREKTQHNCDTPMVPNSLKQHPWSDFSLNSICNIELSLEDNPKELQRRPASSSG